MANCAVRTMRTVNLVHKVCFGDLRAFMVGRECNREKRVGLKRTLQQVFFTLPTDLYRKGYNHTKCIFHDTLHPCPVGLFLESISSFHTCSVSGVSIRLTGLSTSSTGSGSLAFIPSYNTPSIVFKRWQSLVNYHSTKVLW